MHDCADQPGSLRPVPAVSEGIFLARDCWNLGHLFASFHRSFESLDHLCMTSVHLDRTKWFYYHVIVVIRELHRDARVSYLQLSRLLSCFLNRVN